MGESSRLVNPKFAIIVLTYKCNNRCKWCYAAPLDFSSQEMSLEKAKKVLDLLKKLGVKVVGFIGGEPTLYTELFPLVKYAKKEGFDITLYTNGRKLADESFLNELIEAGVNQINISIQSIKSKVHDSITGCDGSLNETIKGIENCFKRNVATRLLVVLSHKKLSVYKELMNRFKESTQQFIFFRELPLFCKSAAQQNILSNKESAEIVPKIYDYSKEIGVNCFFYLRMPLCWFEENFLDKTLDKQLASNTCHTRYGAGLEVDVNGKVLPCLQWINSHSMDLFQGNKIISKKLFLEKWNSGQPKKIRDKLRCQPSEKCKSCKYWEEHCTGGCPLLEFELPLCT